MGVRVVGEASAGAVIPATFGDVDFDSALMRTSSILVTLCLFLPQASGTLRPDADKQCESCPAWNRHLEPFQIFANSYYVGTAGLSAVLVAGDAGHFLIDGALPQSAVIIDQNIRTLGFRTEDVRFILASHAHYDHVGGIAALQRFTGATVAMSAAGVRALAAGGPTADDPQYGMGIEANAFPKVGNLRAVGDGETLRTGRLKVTAHLTPGHTPGGTTWTWQSCEGTRCLNMVYADSLTAVSSDGFRFTGGNGRPDVTPAFLRTIDKVASLPCDVIISTHPGATGLTAKLKARAGGAGVAAFMDPAGCRAYADNARTALLRRIDQERR